MMQGHEPTMELPTLTEVLIPGQPHATPPASSLAPAPAADLLGPLPIDVEALEARLLEQLQERLRATLEQRVHASVVPAVSLLADRIAYKAAQEVAADLADRMHEDLKAAVQQAVADALKGS